MSLNHEGIQSLVVPKTFPERCKVIWDKLGIHPFRACGRIVHCIMGAVGLTPELCLTGSFLTCFSKSIHPTIFVKFILIQSLFPAIAFALEKFQQTNNNLGVRFLPRACQQLVCSPYLEDNLYVLSV